MRALYTMLGAKPNQPMAAHVRRLQGRGYCTRSIRASSAFFQKLGAAGPLPRLGAEAAGR